MKKVTFLFICFISTISLSQTNNVVCTDPAHSAPVTLNFVKNESGEMVLRVDGHIQQFNIQVNGASIATLYKEDRAVNLSQAGFDAAILAVDTKSGNSGSQADTQAPIPPVMSAVNPPLATPY